MVSQSLHDEESLALERLENPGPVGTVAGNLPPEHCQSCEFQTALSVPRLLFDA